MFQIEGIVVSQVLALHHSVNVSDESGLFSKSRVHGVRRWLVKCGLLKDNNAEELAKAAYFVTAAQPLIVLTTWI